MEQSERAVLWLRWLRKSAGNQSFEIAEVTTAMLRVEQKQRQAGGMMRGSPGRQADCKKLTEFGLFIGLRTGGDYPPELPISSVSRHGPNSSCAHCYCMKTLRQSQNTGRRFLN